MIMQAEGGINKKKARSRARPDGKGCTVRVQLFHG